KLFCVRANDNHISCQQWKRSCVTERGGEGFPRRVVQRRAGVEVSDNDAVRREHGATFIIKFARAEMEGHAASAVGVQHQQIVWRFGGKSTQIISPIFDDHVLPFVDGKAKEALRYVND